MANTKAKVGLIGLVNDEAKADFWGTMRRVADIGYQGVEGAVQLLQGDVAANVERFHQLGLQVLTVSASREQLRDQLDKVIREAKSLQSSRASVWWAPCDTRDAVLADAELYNKAGAKLAAEGIKLCYHNHHHEFRNVFNGVCALDILAANTDPAAVYFEIDIAWVTVGGEDPVRRLRNFGSRVPAIHVKDIFGLDAKGQFTTVGTGLVKVRESVQAAIDIGVEYVIVEQDRLRHLTTWETVTASYLNLKETGLV